MSHIARSLGGKGGRATSQPRREGAESRKCADFGTPAMKLKAALALRNRFRRQDKLASSGCGATMWSVAGEGPRPEKRGLGPAVTFNFLRCVEALLFPLLLMP